MSKLTGFLAKFKGVTHLVAIGVSGAAGYLATHPDDVALLSQFAVNHKWVFVPGLLTLLAGLYHNPSTQPK